jgi:hypothetical protein
MCLVRAAIRRRFRRTGGERCEWDYGWVGDGEERGIVSALDYWLVVLR